MVVVIYCFYINLLEFCYGERRQQRHEVRGREGLPRVASPSRPEEWSTPVFPLQKQAEPVRSRPFGCRTLQRAVGFRDSLCQAPYLVPETRFFDMCPARRFFRDFGVKKLSKFPCRRVPKASEPEPKYRIDRIFSTACPASMRFFPQIPLRQGISSPGLRAERVGETVAEGARWPDVVSVQRGLAVDLW